MPKSMIPALMAEPDEALSVMAHQNDFMQGYYTFPDVRIARNRIHLGLMRRSTPRQLPSMMVDIMDEIKEGYNEFWGTDTSEWREISLHDDMLKIATRMSTRFFLGPTFCTLDEVIGALPDPHRAHVS